MKIRPMHDRVLVKRKTTEEESAGGIIIPESAQKETEETKGEVVAVGQGLKLDSGSLVPMDVKVGDTVIFGDYAGTDIKIEGQDYLLMKEEEILAVIED